MLNASQFVTTCTGLIDEKMAWRTIFNHISASVFGKGHAARFIKKFGERPVVNTIAASLAYVLYDFGSWHASLWWQRRQVAHSIRRGSHVEVPEPAYVCDRTAIINGLHNLLHSSTSEAGLYKVIVGPLACGKTWCVKAAIEKNSTGVLYVDAQSGYKFSIVLAHEAGIKLTPLPNLLESFRHHTSIFHREPVHFNLPNGSASDQINYVFDNIRRASAYYHKVYNSRPTLVIDNVDVIKETDIALYRSLIRRCRSLVSEKVVNVILVSSGDHAIPTVETISEMSRRGAVIRIPDVSTEDAIKLLEAHNCSKTFANKVADCTGGRLLYLMQALDVKNVAECFGEHDQDAILHKVMSHLKVMVADDYKRSKVQIGQDLFNMKAGAMEVVTTQQSVTESQLLPRLAKKYKSMDQKKLETALNELLKGNVLVLRGPDGKLEFQTPLHKDYWRKIEDKYNTSIEDKRK